MSAQYAAAYTSLNGLAELSYVKYKAEAADARFAGESFAQRYSLTYTASNLRHREQPRYYNLLVGYDWLSFDTKTSTRTHKTRINDVFGKFRYDGQVGYNPDELPFFFTAYATDSNPVYFKNSPGEISLLSNDLIYNIEGKYKSERYGASLIFDPDRANSVTLRGLPRMHFDYNETFMKTLGSYYKQDYKIRNISVAGLGKGSNWLQFRSTDFVDNLYPANNFNQKQFQIGLVDTRGNRLWSALTNWISVSADGQFTNKKGATGFEEYDLNFMAIATRRAWQARTFMNYNRNIATVNDRVTLQETVAKIPVYVKGLYGPDTDWYARVSFVRGQQLENLRTKDKYSNTVSVGGTTLNRSSFTLAPSLTVTTSSGYNDDFDRLDLLASLETNSTSRFSRTTGIAARTYFNYIDDGYDAETSKTWKQHFTLNATYRPDSKFIYSLKQDMEIGEGTDSILATAGSTGNERYFTARTEAYFSWNPTAALLNTLTAFYDYRTSESSPGWQELTLNHRFMYNKLNTYCRIDTTYAKIDKGTDSRWGVVNSGEVQYRPDRYSDTMLRYTYSKQSNTIYTQQNSTVNSKQRFDLLERYNYNFFSRAGVVRKLATLSQEFSINGYEQLGKKRYTYSALFSGSYSPTARLSLHGSARYENNDEGRESFYYSAGLGADFKLLSTSLEYANARRPSDDRIEERLTAAVRRVF